MTLQRSVLLVLIAGVAVALTAMSASADELKLGKPTICSHAIVRLSSEHAKVRQGDSVKLEYEFRYDGPKASDLPAKVEFESFFEGRVRVFPHYNPWLLAPCSPSSGWIAVFDSEDRFVGRITGGPRAGNVAARTDDWIELAPGVAIGKPIRVPTLATRDDDSFVLTTGCFKLQVVLTRRVWSGNPFAAARAIVHEKRRRKRFGFDKLDPSDKDYREKLAKANAAQEEDLLFALAPPVVKDDDEDFRLELPTHIKSWLHPTNDEIVFRSNILEIEVLPAGEMK